MVAHQPSKLVVAGSNPVARSIIDLKFQISNLRSYSAHIAQSVERVLGKDEVTGSNPVVGSSCPVE